MSRLPISTKRPPRLSSDVAQPTMPGDVSVFSTMSTPPPPHDTSRSSAKLVSRDAATCATPWRRNRDRLGAPPAVATGMPFIAMTSCSAARPTPPAAAGSSTRSPGRRPATCLSTVSVVTKTVGVVAAASNDKHGGIGAIARTLATTWDPRQPTARPKTAWPGSGLETPNDCLLAAAALTTTPA
eukprot:363040-Chlamydomonas_euryale.AAC.1